MNVPEKNVAFYSILAILMLVFGFMQDDANTLIVVSIGAIIVAAFLFYWLWKVKRHH